MMLQIWSKQLLKRATNLRVLWFNQGYTKQQAILERLKKSLSHG